MIQNINIARVSLITHGPVNALRTLDGVYIPRDDGVGPRDKQDAGTEGLTGFRESGGRRGARVFVLLKAQGPIVASTNLACVLEKPNVRVGKASPRPPRPLCADITRQKYCDWSAIERDVTWPCVRE